MFLILACTPASVKIDSDTGPSGGDTDTPDETAETGGGESGNETAESGEETGETEETGDSAQETGESGDPPGTEPCSAWFPLDLEGAIWVWTNGGSEVTAEAAGPSRFGGTDAYRIDVSSSSFSASQYFTCTEEGLAIVGYASGIEHATGTTITWDPPALYTPTNLTPDLEWSTDTVLTVESGGRTETASYTARGEGRGTATVEVPAGTFDTIRIALDVGLGYTADQYLAEGVGQVAGTVGELESYSIP